MDQCDAEVLAEQLMRSHGLIRAGWTLGWSIRWRSTLGATEFRSSTIRLSLPDVLSDDAEDVQQLLVHEVAHALIGPGFGHGRPWQERARSIGYVGGRLGTSALAVRREADRRERLMRNAENLGLRPCSSPVVPGVEVWFIARDDLFRGLVEVVRGGRCRIRTGARTRGTVGTGDLLEPVDPASAAGGRPFLSLAPSAVVSPR